jgi:DNA-binding transcriptional LysR family regulator
MELRHLRAFLVAAEEQNLHRAAARLHITQSAVSRQIRALEEHLGQPLFHRQGRQMRLSNSGEAFRKDAQNILAVVHNAGERMRQAASGHVGQLSISLHPNSLRRTVVLRSIRAFKKKFPGVTLSLSQLNSGRLLESIRDGNIDAGFTFNTLDNDPALEQCAIGTDHYVLALPRSHRLAARARLRLRDLADESFVWFQRENNSVFHDQLMKACLAGGLSPRIVQYALSWNMILDLVSIGMGVAFVVSSSSNHKGNVVFRKVHDLPVPIRFDLVWRRDNSSSALAQFVTTVRPLY